jgi:hypothetical protein
MSSVIFAQDFLTLIARAFAASRGEPEPAAVRTGFVTLYRPRVGVAVQANFRRVTATKFPEVRVGVTFRADDGRVNARAADDLATRCAAELAALGYEPWPSETNNDRRFTTPLPVPPPGQDLTAFVGRAVELARGYVELINENISTPISGMV